MSQAIIGIDIGNSCTKINLQLTQTIIIPNKDLLNGNISFNETAFAWLNKHTSFILSLSSVVNDSTTTIIISIIRSKLPTSRIKIKNWYSPEILSLANITNIKEIEHIGVDRALRIYYLSRFKQGSAKISYGCGSAFTVEIIQNNQLIESYIMPGLSMQFNSLHEKTAALPLIISEHLQTNLLKSEKFSTTYSITNGILKSYSGIMHQLTLEYKPNHILLSGGYAELLKNIYRNNNNNIYAYRNLESEILVYLATHNTKMI